MTKNEARRSSKPHEGAGSVVATTAVLAVTVWEPVAFSKYDNRTTTVIFFPENHFLVVISDCLRCRGEHPLPFPKDNASVCGTLGLAWMWANYSCKESLVPLSKLTLLGFNVNMVVDAGARLPIEEMREHIRGHSVFELLETRYADDVDLSLLDDDERRALSAQWKDMESATNARRKMGVERDGLCLLHAFVLEGIQREI